MFPFPLPYRPRVELDVAGGVAILIPDEKVELREVERQVLCDGELQCYEA